MNFEAWKTTRYWESLKGGGPATFECPHCHHKGVFEFEAGLVDRGNNLAKLAILTTCPNLDCKGLVLYFRNSVDGVFQVVPGIVPQFDFKGVSPRVISCLQEASLCFAQACWRATSIMVRRSLEILCEEFNCTGTNLHQRLQGFRTQNILSPALFDAMLELKILGNDAAHVDARDFENITRVEAELALDLTQELIRSLYQHSSLVERLRAQKANNNP